MPADNTDQARVIGALEAGVKAAADTVAELRKIAIDQLAKTAAIETRIASMESELNELRAEYEKARTGLNKLAILLAGGGMAAGGGLSKILSIFGN